MAQELSESEAIRVAAFGLDRPEDSNPEVGPRCGACRLGLVVHESRDPQCVYAEERARLVSSTPTNEAREELAKAFHEAYERLAPEFGYSTRKESAVPWSDVPADNKNLMLATMDAILAALPSLGYVKPEPGEWDELADELDAQAPIAERRGQYGVELRYRRAAAALRQEVTARHKAEAELAALREQVAIAIAAYKAGFGQIIADRMMTALTVSPSEEPKP